MGGKSQAPTPPDYGSLIQQQGQANLAAGQAGANVGRYNTVDPYGSTTWSPTYQGGYKGGKGGQGGQPPATQNGGSGKGSQPSAPHDPTGVQPKNLAGSSEASGPVSQSKDFWGGLGQFLGHDHSSSEGNDAVRAAQNATPQTPFDWSSLIPPPGQYTQTTSFSPGQQALFDKQQSAQQGLAGLLSGKVDQAGGTMPDFGQTPDFKQVNTSGLPDLFAGAEANRNAAQNAIYGRETQFMGDRFSHDQAALESQLANQGLAPGSAAYQKALQDFNRNKNDAYQTAQYNAITGGGQEADRTFGENLQARGQGINEQMLGRNNQIQDFTIGRGNKIQDWTLGQQGQQNAMQQIAQLLGMTQPHMPGGPQGGGGGGGINAPDLTGTAQQQYGNQVGIFNSNQQNQQATYGAIASIIAAAAMAASSTSFKEDFEPAESVLDKVKSLNVMRWRYKPEVIPDPASHIGPMAEEWHSKFGGADDRFIPYIDAIGVLLKSVQELTAKVEKLEQARG